ncbi:uncharacterized protein [Littorina saxatilis]|uniref:uncharacterized protein n=1 Tax=Littorina saxatilis TaxID=31220 RepID=UPI0038B64EF7
MYHRVFERSYSDRRHLVYRVKALTGDRPFSTLDFKSKIPHNKGIESPSYVHMKVFLSELCAVESVPEGMCAGSTELTFEQDKLVCLKDTTSSWQKPLQESMTVQTKAVFDPRFYACQTEKEVNSLVNYCWSKLKEYITSFTKIEEGGSVYFGVFEHKQKRPIWTTAEPMCMQFLTITPAGLGEGLKVWQDNSKGKNKTYYVSKEAKTNEEQSGELRAKAIPLSKNCREHFKRRIAEQVEREMLWTGREKPRDPVQVYFHKVEQSGESDGRVIEIRVNYYHGLCFSDKNGPEAYIPKDKNANKINATSQLQLVPVEDWIQSFKSENWKSELVLKRQDVQWQN